MVLLMLAALRAPLTSLLESMTRILLRSRRLLSASILLLLAGVVVFSAATRRPCLRVCSGAWHLCKTGHMSKSDGAESRQLRMTAEARMPQTAPADSPAAPPSLYHPHQDAIPLAIALVVQIRHFRAPPMVV